MRELLAELAFRAAKVVVAAAIGLVVLALLAGDAPIGPELALLGFLSGAAVVLLVERSPF
jgi:uncharacterized membrane protein YraQ (UPF0718 family)